MLEIKIFRRHNINAFTGIDLEVPSKHRYQYTKSDGEVINCDSLMQFMDESNPDTFLGWRSKDMLQAFPLYNYQSLDEIMADFDFEWHPTLKHLILRVDYRLLDPHSLERSVHFLSDHEYDTFNFECHKNYITHGLKAYKLGMFYESSDK